MLSAESIRDDLHLPVVTIGAVELDAIHKGNGVDDKVIVYVRVLVQVSGHQYLIVVTPLFCG